MVQWIKEIICSICILGTVIHVLPNSSYRKYVNFYIGLLLILMVLKPLAEFFSLDTSFEEKMQIQTLKTELSELNIAWEGMEDLGVHKVEDAWKEELERQITEVAKTGDLEVDKIETELQTDKDGVISAVTVSMEVQTLDRSRENGQEKKEQLAQKISEIYGLEGEQIRIMVRE
ncbi:MAG: stage III sporulation protein AF [Lachnospiraceae bacterium]|nr:stage III sporulation protein AF [Robinsoniella sp.]MDY3766494.1 stage III sporulation protein AF [Lachnospiraceae bacterium]